MIFTYDMDLVSYTSGQWWMAEHPAPIQAAQLSCASSRQGPWTQPPCTRDWQPPSLMIDHQKHHPRDLSGHSEFLLLRCLELLTLQTVLNYAHVFFELVNLWGLS